MMNPDISEFNDPSSVNEAWDGLLGTFRSLGGEAENVRLDHVDPARKLVPVDPSKPVLLRLPKNLQFSVSDLEFTESGIRVSEQANIGTREREFFETYANTFSWGGPNRSESETFVAALDALPDEVRRVLSDNFGMGNLLEGEPAERARRRFLGSRLVSISGREVVVPLIELARHDPNGLEYAGDAEDGLKIHGNAGGEVVVKRGLYDPFKAFCALGLAIRQPFAYSLPLRLKFGERELVVDAAINQRVRRGNFLIPAHRSDASGLALSYLMIGNPRLPRISRGIFVTLAKEAGVDDPDELFDRVLHANRSNFLHLLSLLEPPGVAMVATLRRMVRFQLEAMTHCIGTREI
jgi:hypothetical protein